MDALFPPGPQKSLLFGDAPHFKDNPLNFMLQSARTFGELVHFRFGPAHAYLLNNPRDAHYVLVERHNEFDEKLTLGGALTSAMGHDLFAPKDRAAQRPLRRGAFQARWLNESVESIAASTGQALNGWQGGDPLELLETVTGRMVAATLFGDMRHADYVRRLGGALAAQQDAERFQSPLNPPDWLPTARNRSRNRANITLQQLVNEVLAAPRSPAQFSLLDYLLLGNADRKTVVTEMLLLLRAGYTAAANMLAWAWALLAAHPETEETLHEEIQRVLAGRMPTADDLQNLPYCEMILMETLRLHPPTWLVSRQAKRETRLGDYYLPAGSAVFVSPYIIQHSARHFASPDRFVPERFSADSARRGSTNAYMPFGLGAYASAQHDYALNLGKLVLALGAQRFRLKMTVKPEESASFASAPRGLRIQPERII